MIERKTREFRVRELFDIGRGKTKYIKRYYAEHQGVYPVYSASTIGSNVAGWIDSFDLDCDCLTWTTNGYAGHVIQRSGRLSCTRDVGILTPKPEYKDKIDLRYFVPALTTAFVAAATGRLKENGESDYTKIATGLAANVFVTVPVEDDESPSIQAQTEIADRFGVVRDIQAKLSGMAEHLRSLSITSPVLVGRSETFRIADLFEEPVRGSGALTKHYLSENSGQYPVYSGSSFRDEVIGYADTYMFDGEYITWAADGYAGFAFVRKGKFSANSHCGILKPKSAYSETLYLPFIEIFLTPLLLEIAVGRYRDDGSPDYTRVTSEMVSEVAIILPVDETGAPDLQRQKEIADRMLALADKKRTIVESLQRLARLNVAVEGLDALGPGSGSIRKR